MRRAGPRGGGGEGAGRRALGGAAGSQGGRQGEPQGGGGGGGRGSGSRGRRVTHGGGKEDESAVLWLPAPAAPRPPPAADPREGPRGRHPAAGRARASPKRGRAGPCARRFLLRGRGFGRRLRARLGPGAPRLIQGRRVPARETAEALPGGPRWAVALPAGGGMGRGVVAWRTAPKKAAWPSGMLRVPGGLRAARRNSPSRQSHTQKAGSVPWRAVCFRLFPD